MPEGDYVYYDEFPVELKEATRKQMFLTPLYIGKND